MLRNLGRREDSAAAKLQSSGQIVCQDNRCHQQHFGSAQKVDDILASAGPCFRCLFVGNQGIGDQGQSFIKQKEGEKVLSKGNAQGGRKCKRETAEVTGLRVLL